MEIAEFKKMVRERTPYVVAEGAPPGIIVLLTQLKGQSPPIKTADVEKWTPEEAAVQLRVMVDYGMREMIIQILRTWGMRGPESKIVSIRKKIIGPKEH